MLIKQCLLPWSWHIILIPTMEPGICCTKSSVSGLPSSFCPIYTLKPICWQSVMTRWSHLLFVQDIQIFMLFHCIVINTYMFHPCPPLSAKVSQGDDKLYDHSNYDWLNNSIKTCIWKPPSGSMLYNWSCNYLPISGPYNTGAWCPEKGHATDSCSSHLWKWGPKSEEDRMEV